MNKVLCAVVVSAMTVGVVPQVWAHPGHESFMSSFLHDFMHVLESLSLTGTGLAIAVLAGYAVYRSLFR